jgi:hypothetical protein
MNSMSQALRRPCLLLAILGGSLLLSGCTPERVTHAPEIAAPRPVRRGIAAALDEMDLRRKGVDSVVARMNVHIQDPARGRDIALSAHYQGNREGDFRMRLSYGVFPVLDMSVRGSQAELWLPRKNKFLRGPRSALGEGDNRELALVAQMGSAHELFFPRAWTPQAQERRRDPNTRAEIVEVLARSGACVRRLGLVPGNSVAEWVAVYNLRGEPQGKITYEDYRFPQPRAGEGSATPVYPGRITFEGNASGRLFRFEVEEFVINVPLVAEKFEVKPGEDCAILDLQEALKRHEPLFE